MGMQRERLAGIRRAYDLTVRQYREGSDPLAGVLGKVKRTGRNEEWNSTKQ